MYVSCFTRFHVVYLYFKYGSESEISPLEELNTMVSALTVTVTIFPTTNTKCKSLRKKKRRFHVHKIKVKSFIISTDFTYRV